jgi:hypothetical protein
MALRQIYARRVEWFCKNCAERSKPGANIVTTEPAERHVEETAHAVIAYGTISYNITQGDQGIEDPFAPRSAV